MQIIAFGIFFHVRHVTIFELLRLWPSYAGVVPGHRTDYVGVLSPL